MSSNSQTRGIRVCIFNEIPQVACMHINMKSTILNHSKNYDHGIWSHHVMENRWGKMEAVTDFIFLDSKITVDSDYSHETKRCLLLKQKTMANLDSVLKNRDISLSTKVCISVFQQLCIEVRVGPQERLSAQELMHLNWV